MSFQKHIFVVTRQRTWPDGDLQVEISQGGLDYTNPGALSGKYSGEFEQYEGMTPALEAGISIYKAWRHDLSGDEKKSLGIAIGNTGGSTCFFDASPLTDKLEDELRVKARKFDESLPRCAHCGDILGKERFGMHGEYDCCSSYCAEQHYAPEPEPDEDEDE